jgi:hypothetical protein
MKSDKDLEKARHELDIEILCSLLNNRIVTDFQGNSVTLAFGFFEKYRKPTMINQSKISTIGFYLKYVDDILKKPQEIWFDYDEKTIRCFKKYSRNVCVVVIENSKLIDYIVIPSEKLIKIEKLRQGFVMLA